MGVLLVLILVFLCGIAAIVLSILAWRLKKDIYFYLGIAFTAIILFYLVFNYEYFYNQYKSGNFVLLVLHMSLVAIPLYFLISAKLKKPNGSFDNAEAGGPVTEEYLNEIINAPDEEVDFEEEYNLK